MGLLVAGWLAGWLAAGWRLAGWLRALVGSAKALGAHVEIKNVSAVDAMVAVMRRTGTNMERPIVDRYHFFRSVQAGTAVSLCNDPDIVDQKKVEGAMGMEYVVLVWPLSTDDDDPRSTWSPEVFSIKHDPTNWFFPKITCHEHAAPRPHTTGNVFGADPAFSNEDLGELDDLLAKAIDRSPTSRSFQDDCDAPRNMYPWFAVIPRDQLTEDTEYFCVQTWGEGPLTVFGEFHKVQKDMWAELKRGAMEGLIGFTGGGRHSAVIRFFTKTL